MWREELDWSSPASRQEQHRYTDLCETFKIKADAKLTKQCDETLTSIAVVLASHTIVQACVSSDAKDGVKLRSRMGAPRATLRQWKVMPTVLPQSIRQAYTQGLEMTFTG